MKTFLKLIKQCTPIFFVAAFAFHCQSMDAQILKKISKRAEKAAENAVIRKTERKVTKETNKKMDTLLDGNSKKKNEKTADTKKDENSDNSSPDNGETKSESEDSNSQDKLKPWSKYNFVPGDKIIFQDDLAGEENGEFPSRWDLTKGSAENANMGDTNIINFENESIITPLMDSDEYLPEVFTIEFDAYFDDERMDSYVYHQRYNIRFWNGYSNFNLPNKGGSFYPLKIYRYGATLTGKVNGQDKDYKGWEESLKEKQPVWRHIAISFNKRSLKVFVDQYRSLNIPNLGFQPKMISIEAYTNKHIKDPYIRSIKNIRIAEGGKKLYDRVLAEGKFVTSGILFDVNKATIKPESMGVINQVAKMMQEHSELKFSIEGHTDSDGDSNYNQKLSEQRAASVKEALKSLGIEDSRMESKGFGESVAVFDNNTSEGKANNRRVEFVKM